jgi:molybdate-binding protein/DNA-binding XRE family transcriptional regulator
LWHVVLKRQCNVNEKARQEIKNNLAAIREKRGLSAATLAKTVGVSRQTIYAIEGGSYVPNTGVGLRLARALAVNVEDLFSLPEPLPDTETRAGRVAFLSLSDELQPGQPVQLCEVAGRLMAAAASPASWYLPLSDGVVSGNLVRGKARIRIHQPETDLRNRLLIAGCDPAMAVLARHLQPAGVELILLHQNSSQALSLLKGGCIHVAGTHLRDRATGEPNIAAITKAFQPGSVAVISFALWQEGLITANGNPKKIESVEDLSRADVTFVNREPGAGSRNLLDTYLKRLRLDSRRIRGYERTAPGHLAAAGEVKTGNVDCCIATEAAARVFGLSFSALQSSRYDLVVRKQDLNLPGVQTLFDAITRLNFRSKLKNVGGYDTTVTGERVL